MERPKSKIAKTKSSNLTTERQKERKSESARKKSKSNAEFQTLLVKKRGVYVENKLSLDERAKEPKAEELPAKPPPRPKPGSKRFLASVLTILSKSTTATQFPEDQDKTKIKSKKNAKDTTDTNLRKKPKFRSKILNTGNNGNDKFEVIQNRKDIVLTPSVYSEMSFNEEHKRKSVKIDLDDSQKARECANIRGNDDAVTGIVKEVIEGRTTKKVKMVDAEPTTLVSEEKNDKFYNFFVDLLETTISVCHMKAKYDAPRIPSGKSSKVVFEMDEEVVKKLNVGTAMPASPKSQQLTYKQNDYGWNTELVTNWDKAVLPELPTSPRRRKPNSFIHFRRSVPPAPAPHSNSVANTKKTTQQRKKKNLLNILKEELAVGMDEPQNLFQALKVMAKNKKKQRIRFDTNSIAEGKCMLKARKVISRNKRSKSKYNKKTLPTGDAKKTDSFRRKLIPEKVSNHSLEVYDFDSTRKNRPEKNEKEVYLMFSSSSSLAIPSDSETSSIGFNV